MYKKKMTGSAIRTHDAMSKSAERNHCAMPNTITHNCSLTMLVSLTARGKKKNIHNTDFAFYSSEFPSSKLFRQGGPEDKCGNIAFIFFPP